MSGRVSLRGVGAALVAVALAAQVCGAGAWMALYEQESWYREATAPERVWCGILQRHEPPGGPAGRPSVRFALSTKGVDLPIYAPGAAPLLDSLVGARVAIVGKRVDLTDEGFGVELWPGRIATRVTCQAAAPAVFPRPATPLRS